MKYFDCIIVGGGLSGCLLFYSLKKQHPEKSILLIESNSELCGNHTWCFHEHDVDLIKNVWLKDLIAKSWNSYDVIFKGYQRKFESKYHAITSTHMSKVICEAYGNDILLNAKVDKVSAKYIKFDNEKSFISSTVIDARGWSDNIEALGFQKFVGLNLKLKKPHGLTSVRLKDANVEQIDGYRFFYLLPWSEYEILIEDTYYSNSNSLDEELIQSRILDYAKSNGLEVDTIVSKEKGILPLTSSFIKLRDAFSIGAKSGAFNPVTGYSFPYTMRRVESILKLNNFESDEWKEALALECKKDFNNSRYFHILNKMLFLASDPKKRYVIFERFYKLSEELIRNFYNGKLTNLQKLRILMGKPPVPVYKAIKSIFMSTH